ncbi:MAG: M20/M25/M40 family metallo-hydrolase [Pyrinomonadaceae bacterium]|nr:M20/M25/M40 family metallo-hydrolase [Pyrinomonadaceae bacterium]
MKNLISRSTLIAVILVGSNLMGLAQAGGKSRVDERNVRAAMQFLASDAMQGRGSGTLFERITAEYVGSQFMQFGLEPAGETDWDGKPSFVQTVTIERKTFEANPFLKIGGASLEHGKEMLVVRTNNAAIQGKLQKLAIGEKPEAGAIVFLKNSASATNLNQVAQPFFAAGASMVIVEETPQYRGGWANFAARKPSFNASVAKPSALIVASKDAVATIAALADGSPVEFGGTVTTQKNYTWNATGKLTGSDKTASAEVIVLSSHLDHIGVNENAPGDDKISNGADDDASGTVAVMEIARALALGKRPKRTIYFVCFGSEERGGLGSKYFADNLPFPQDKFVANLQFEMIGRPDSKVKPEELWLTGYERSNLGPELAKRGAKLVQDPHPTQNFFQRSDNYGFAVRGIIAHTVSSFGLHTDYHRVTDEVKTIDFGHMTKSINSMVEPIIWFANSNFVPAWNEGKKP